MEAQFTPIKNLWKISAPALSLYIRSTPRFILYHTKCTLMTTSIVNRSILKQIFLSFRAMFYRERPLLVGVDKSGNRYFEAPPNKASEHTHLSKLPKRFFLMPGQNGLECSHGNIDVELSSVPPEWHSWLSHRRSNPPTEEEIEANAVSRINRLSRAAELEVKYNEERQEMIKQGLLHTDKVESSNIHSKSSFPIHSDLQISPDESHKGTK